MFTRERFDDPLRRTLHRKNQVRRRFSRSRRWKSSEASEASWQSKPTGGNENSSELSSSASNAGARRWRAPLSRTRRPACTLPRACRRSTTAHGGRTHATEKPGERVERPRAEKVAASRWHVATTLFFSSGLLAWASLRRTSARNLVSLPPPPPPPSSRHCQDERPRVHPRCVCGVSLSKKRTSSSALF